MKTYLDGMKDVIENGHDHEDRTGVGRRSVFGRQYRFDLTKGFPLVTTKKVSIENIIKETLWFISGSQRSLDLEEQGVNIWKQWTPTAEDAEEYIRRTQENWKYQDGVQPKEAFDTFKNMHLSSVIGRYSNKVDWDTFKEAVRSRVGTIGPMYGAVWRGNYGNGHVDQLRQLVFNLKMFPFHSRHCVTAWIPELLPVSGVDPKTNVLMGKGALAPCHCFFQCFVTPAEQEGGKLRLSLNIMIRSNDTCIGAPYNIAQYAILLMMIAKVVNMDSYELIVTVGDQHVYTDQLDLAIEQIQREPYKLPTLLINPKMTDDDGEPLEDFDLDDFKLEDFTLVNYEHHSFIRYPVAT
jgi:thymidylate synthase